MDIWGSVTPPILVTENTSLSISVTIIKLRNKKEWFAYPSFGTLKRKKENFNIVIGDRDIGISKKCQPIFFQRTEYVILHVSIENVYLFIIMEIQRSFSLVIRHKGATNPHIFFFRLYFLIELNSLIILDTVSLYIIFNISIIEGESV